MDVPGYVNPDTLMSVPIGLAYRSALHPDDGTKLPPNNQAHKA